MAKQDILLSMHFDAPHKPIPNRKFVPFWIKTKEWVTFIDQFKKFLDKFECKIGNVPTNLKIIEKFNAIGAKTEKNKKLHFYITDRFKIGLVRSTRISGKLNKNSMKIIKKFGMNSFELRFFKNKRAKLEIYDGGTIGYIYDAEIENAK